MVAERQWSELAEGGAEPPCREGGKELALGTVRGAGLHSSEVPMGDWLSLFLLDFLSPFPEPSRWLSAAHTAWLARWLLSSGFQPLPCPSPQVAPWRGGCWLPFSTLWTCSGDLAPRSFSSRALTIISAFAPALTAELGRAHDPVWGGHMLLLVFGNKPAPAPRSSPRGHAWH